MLGRIKLDPDLSLRTRIHSKQTICLNAGPEAFRGIIQPLQDTHIGNDFLRRTPIAKEIMPKIHK